MSPQESINLFGENKNQSPIIHEATNSEEIYNMAANGFVIIGYSMFNTANINKNEIFQERSSNEKRPLERDRLAIKILGD